MEQLEIDLCKNTEFGNLFDRVSDKDSLYCLKDYSSYKVKGDKEDLFMHSLKVSFEICASSTCDRDLALKYLQMNSFRFPYQNSYFNPSTGTEHAGLYRKWDQDFEYPYVNGQMMRAHFLFEQGMLKSDTDVSGFTKLFQLEQRTRFFALHE